MPENKYQKEAALFLRMPDGRRCTLRMFPAWNAGTVRLLALYAGKAFYKRSTLCSAAVPAFWLLSAEQIISAYQKARDNCACNPDAFQQHHNYHSDRNPKHCKSAYLFHISTSILSNLTPAWRHRVPYIIWGGIPFSPQKKAASDFRFSSLTACSSDYARSTLPDFKQEVQTYSFFVAPFTLHLTDLMFGLNILFVFLLEWLTLWPKRTPFPQTEHFAIVTPPCICECSKSRPDAYFRLATWLFYQKQCINAIRKFIFFENVKL